MLQNKDLIKEPILNKYQNAPITISENIQNNFFVSTLSRIKLNEQDAGYIAVSEEANDILIELDKLNNKNIIRN